MRVLLGSISVTYWKFVDTKFFDSNYDYLIATGMKYFIITLVTMIYS